jgi:pimeloyl-ACP methyl ester carboxylesterase
MGSVVESIALWSLRRQGFISQHVPTKQGRVHLMSAPGGGALPPIVLMHGLGARGAQYQRLVRCLRPHTRRLILPDAPGHGLSDTPPEPSVSALAEGLNEALAPPWTSPPWSSATPWAASWRSASPPGTPSVCSASW